MNKTEMMYFQQDDVIHLALMPGKEANSVELSPNITAELNEQGEIIGIEILEASAFLRDMIMETAQAKLLTAPLLSQTLRESIRSDRYNP